MDIHLDALGGMAGDMFAAAVLDAFPELEAPMLEAVGAATRGDPVTCRLVAHNDGVLQGRRFLVEDVGAEPAGDDRHAHHHIEQHGHRHGGQAHGHGDEHGRHFGHDSHRGARGGGHGHRAWSEIRAGLEHADLAEGVHRHALAIFRHLAVAEARVHGIAVDDVTFHEVGARDSIADIVAAGFLVDALAAGRWSVGALPLGSGRVRSAHGLLPVPAPATTLLLEGFATIEDGVPGERVTPTGAAILRHLCGGEGGEARPAPRRLGRTGIGFGTRILPGISNCLRLLAFDEAKPKALVGHRELAVIEFEVDDQTAEDLAMGLDRLRAHGDVFDVVQTPVFGKKGRMMTHVRVLARADALDAAIAACFRETTTIGLRHHTVAGATLPRHEMTVELDGHRVRVKIVDRPGGRTAKAEADDALAHETHARRLALRREAECLALVSSEAEPSASESSVPQRVALTAEFEV